MKKTLIFVLLLSACFGTKAWFWTPEKLPDFYRCDFSVDCGNMEIAPNSGNPQGIKNKIFIGEHAAFTSGARGVGVTSYPTHEYSRMMLVRDIKPWTQSTYTCSGIAVSYDSPVVLSVSEGLSKDPNEIFFLHTIRARFVSLGNSGVLLKPQPEVSSTTIKSLGKNNGVEEYEAEITLNIPVTSLLLGVNRFNQNKDNEIYTLWAIWDGVIITHLDIEAVRGAQGVYAVEELKNNLDKTTFELSESQKSLQAYKDALREHLELIANTDKIRTQINTLNTAALEAHYKQTANADVNEDGYVNAADVVSVYNSIIDGPDESGIYGDHEFVDLGLPSGTMWATCNVGASVPEAYGNFYAYKLYSVGFLEGYNCFDWIRYKDYPHLRERPDGWDGWNVPTYLQAEELIANCDFWQVEVNGVKCMQFTSKINKNKLILPLAGSFIEDNGYFNDGVDDTDYLTSSPDYNTEEDGLYKKCYKLYFLNTNPVEARVGSGYSYTGCSLRMVFKK